MTGHPTGERGSATIWVVACCALLMMVAGVATIRSLAVLARHRAEAGADLAALAAAGQIGIGDRGCVAAARVAGQNGGRLRACSVRLAPDGRSGTVSVSVAVSVTLPIAGAREIVATARAARLRAASAACVSCRSRLRVASSGRGRPASAGRVGVLVRRPVPPDRLSTWTSRSPGRPRATSPSSP